MQFCPPAGRRAWLLLPLFLVVPRLFAQSTVDSDLDLSRKTTLQYEVEWRLIRAGTATVVWQPQTEGVQADLHLRSAGLVSKLYRVHDDYTAQMNEDLCVSTIFIKAEEGKRRRETKVSFDASAGKASYLERDLIRNNVVLSKELETPACVHDYLGALNKLRTYKLEPGQSVQIPMSDGKKFASVRVEAQEREQVKTPAGTFKTMRFEVFMFNSVLINKKARMFVWLTEDARRLPVQLRARMQFLVGTITLQLEKEERN